MLQAFLHENVVNNCAKLHENVGNNAVNLNENVGNNGQILHEKDRKARARLNCNSIAHKWIDLRRRE